ncbi:MAG TPA: hypothetical protein VF876_06660 [Burkholderiales bacterium]
MHFALPFAQLLDIRRASQERGHLAGGLVLLERIRRQAGVLRPLALLVGTPLAMAIPAAAAAAALVVAFATALLLAFGARQLRLPQRLAFHTWRLWLARLLHGRHCFFLTEIVRH